MEMQQLQMQLNEQAPLTSLAGLLSNGYVICNVINEQTLTCDCHRWILQILACDHHCHPEQIVTCGHHHLLSQILVSDHHLPLTVVFWCLQEILKWRQ